MKKTFMKITFLIILLMTIIATTVIYANTNLYAGALFSDNMGGFFDEQEAAVDYALETYQNAGYTPLKAFEPSELTLRSNMLMNNILLVCSHGSVDAVTFDTTGLITGPARYYDEKYHLSINEFDWTTKKLVVLCACETAGEGSSDSLSITGRIATAGAQTAIGWYDVIYTVSSPDWLNNFHSKLAVGYNPLEAVNYANGESYLMTSIRKTYVCYNSLSPISTNLDYTTSENNILNTTNSRSRINISDIETLIKEYDSTFDIANYEKTTSDGIYIYDVTNNVESKYTSYIDYNYTIGDYTLNSGYTVVLDKDDNVLEIIDNTKDFNYEELKNRLENEVTTCSVSNDTDIINTKYYYDLTTNKKYMKIEYSENSNKTTDFIEI